MPKLAPLVSRSFRTPKGCHVRFAELRSNGAYVGYDCGGAGSGTFPLPEGDGISNYPKALVKGVQRIATPGAETSGTGARVGFALHPRYVTCSKRRSDTTLRCIVHLEDGTALSGARKRRR
jgi:hypothetical protein